MPEGTENCFIFLKIQQNYSVQTIFIHSKEDKMLMNDKMLKHGEMSKYESSSNMNSDVVGMEIHRSTHGSKYC